MVAVMLAGPALGVSDKPLQVLPFLVMMPMPNGSGSYTQTKLWRTSTIDIIT